MEKLHISAFYLARKGDVFEKTLEHVAKNPSIVIDSTDHDAHSMEIRFVKKDLSTGTARITVADNHYRSVLSAYLYILVGEVPQLQSATKNVMKVVAMHLVGSIHMTGLQAFLQYPDELLFTEPSEPDTSRIGRATSLDLILARAGQSGADGLIKMTRTNGDPDEYRVCDVTKISELISCVRRAHFDPSKFVTAFTGEKIKGGSAIRPIRIHHGELRNERGEAVSEKDLERDYKYCFRVVSSHAD